MTAIQIRARILTILQRQRTLMTSAQIVEALAFHGLQVTTVQVGVNLGYLRAAGLVDRRSAPRWGKPYFKNGKWNFSTENWWYHTEVITKKQAIVFTQRIRNEVELNARDNQRAKGRAVTRLSRPITDDMRQMLVDLTGGSSDGH